jgi:NADPH:quinone reductase-like Zn-dependent oxidoreductase
MQPGERVLIHGAAGAVGLFAVQLAHLHGAYVIATASARNTEFVNRLGADEVIDYQTARFEEQVEKVDIVFDGVGGETLERSWAVLKPGGRMVTIAAESEGTTDQRVQEAFFIVEPNQKQLCEVAKLLDAGKLKTFVSAVVPLEEASVAYSGAVRDKRGYGKVVIAISI